MYASYIICLTIIQTGTVRLYSSTVLIECSILYTDVRTPYEYTGMWQMKLIHTIYAVIKELLSLNAVYRFHRIGIIRGS
jgi:hypothetical protein